MIRSRNGPSTTQTSTAGSISRISNGQHHHIRQAHNPVSQSGHRNDSVGYVHSFNPSGKRLFQEEDLINHPTVKKLKATITLQEQQLKIAKRTSNRRMRNLTLKKKECKDLKAQLAVKISQKEKIRIIADMLGPAGVLFHGLIRRMVMVCSLIIYSLELN